MAENYNFFNKPFGLNVQLPTRTIEQVQETAKKNINIFSPLFTYLEQNDAVFSGDISLEIDKYNRQMYSLGAIMRQGKAEVTFDTQG